jgi:aminotransferase
MAWQPVSESGHNFYQDIQQSFQAKRDRFCQVLDRLGLAPTIPQGAYYVLADVSRLPGDTGKERAMHVLEKTGVAGVPGEAFFSSRPWAAIYPIQFCQDGYGLE